MVYAFSYSNLLQILKIDHLVERLRLLLLKGGIPAAPSGTATLLRLSPSYQFYPR